MRGYSHYRLRALHEQYGDVVRIGTLSHLDSVIILIVSISGPNELSIRKRDTIVPLLGTSGVPKSPGKQFPTT